MALSANQRTMLAIAMAVTGYWTISISLVFINKIVFSGAEYRIDAPSFISWYQCACTVLMCYFLGELNIHNVPKVEVKRNVAHQIMPLSCIFTASIVFNNICLKYVSVSFFFLARSLTVVSNVIFTFIALGQRTSLPAIACCGVIVFGLFLGNDQELFWSLQVVALGGTSSILTALTIIYIKKMLPLVKNDPWRLMFYHSFNTYVLFLPLIVLFGEPPVIFASLNAVSFKFWDWMAMSGVLGVFVSFAAVAQIKYTSSPTHKASVTVAAAAQAVIALAAHRNPINFWNALSFAIVILGSLFYKLSSEENGNNGWKRCKSCQHCATTIITTDLR